MSSDGETVDGYYLDLEFPPPPAERPYIYINMVASVDGKIAVDGSERGIGSAADKRLFYELRAHADAVLDGATTARASGASARVQFEDLRAFRRARGLSPNPLGVLITASGNLDTAGPFFTSTEFDAVVFAAERIPHDRLIALQATRRPVHLVPNGREAMHTMAGILRWQYGAGRLLCEGGGTVNSEFIHLGAVDELFLTIAPKIIGGHDSVTPVEGEPFHRDTMPALDLIAWRHFAPTGEVFTRWRFHRQTDHERP